MSTNHCGGGGGECSEEAWQGSCSSATVLNGGSMELEKGVRRSGAEDVFWAVCFITPSKGVIPITYKGKLKNTRYK